MNTVLSIPIEVRVAILFVLGAALGGQLNRAIYRLAWNRRAIGPWSPCLPGAPRRHWTDRIPVLGWWGLRREASLHGRSYWLRPLLLELVVGIGLAALYYYETERLLLWPDIGGLSEPRTAVVHAQYLSHVLLIALMIVATFIDFDERMIPDEVTLTGTVLGLILAVALPYSSLPTVFHGTMGRMSVDHMVVTSSTFNTAWNSGLGGPYSWPAWLDGPKGLLLGLVCVAAWFFAILPKTWTLRHGFKKGLDYLVASIRRHGHWIHLVLIIVLPILTLGTWWFSAVENGLRWQSLFSALVGMCFGGGLVWVVRIIGGHVLRTEAMGFGDVTLMAMIGAFVGWQAAFLTFFLAPVTAVLVATLQRLLTGDRRIAFGPYLCLATLIIVVAWNSVWVGWALPMFSLGWFIPGVLAICLPMMGGMLWLWRIIRDVIFGY